MQAGKKGAYRLWLTMIKPFGSALSKPIPESANSLDTREENQWDLKSSGNSLVNGIQIKIKVVVVIHHSKSTQTSGKTYWPWKHRTSIRQWKAFWT